MELAAATVARPRQDAPSQGTAGRATSRAGQPTPGQPVLGQPMPGQVMPGQSQRHPALPLPIMAVVWVLASLSGLAVWVLVYAFALSGIQEASAQHALYAALRTEIAQGIAPLGGNVPLGQPVAILRVPQAGISAVVLEGTTSGVLESGPGLEADTPLPGQAGLSYIYGRQTMFGGPFRHLAALRRGDLFLVTTGEGTFTYRVDDVRYPGDPVPPPPAPGQGKMILLTAVGAGWRGAGAPNQLLYVDTTLVSKPAGTPPGMPAAVPVSQQPMQGDTSVLFALVLWLQLLLLTVLAVAWARARWSGWQTWMVGAPAVLGVVWIVTETAVQLLPNLL